MATQLVSRSNDTAKWTKALERAIAEDVDVLIEPISGEAFVESASRPDTLYQVSATTCSCPAGRKGQICKHRACYLAQIGELPLETAKCISCTAGKIEEWGVSGPIGWKPCDVCGGSGTLPVLPVMPAQFPEPRRIPCVAA